MKQKTSAIYGRIPTSLKKRFLKALEELGHSQQYVIVKMVNGTIKEASGKTS